jgi:hypothetical protein
MWFWGMERAQLAPEKAGHDRLSLYYTAANQNPQTTPGSDFSPERIRTGATIRQGRSLEIENWKTEIRSRMPRALQDYAEACPFKPARVLRVRPSILEFPFSRSILYAKRVEVSNQAAGSDRWPSADCRRQQSSLAP